MYSGVAFMLTMLVGLTVNMNVLALELYNHSALQTFILLEGNDINRLTPRKRVTGFVLIGVCWYYKGVLHSRSCRLLFQVASATMETIGFHCCKKCNRQGWRGP